MKKDSKIYVSGHNGMVGSAIVRELKKQGYSNIITLSHKKLDLRDKTETERFFITHEPEYVFNAAAKVGGIYANVKYPASFIYDNINIQTNIIHNSYKYGVKKLVFLGSSCIYPRDCNQPIKESYLLEGQLESTNDAYAIAKIAGIKMCQAYNKQYGTNFISLMPTNLYGEGDNYHTENSHVFAALIKKFHYAKANNEKNVTLWGTGEPFREFLYVDDFADATIFLMNNYNDNDIINVGTGVDVTIKELASMIKDVVGFDGGLLFDNSKPNGTPKKLLDISKLNNLGWKHKTDLIDGIRKTYKIYLKSN